MLKLAENGHLDEDYVQQLVAQLRASSISRAVLLAQDCRYDAREKPDWQKTTSVYVPNDCLFEVVKRFPGLFIPCVSVNPKRRDAVDELERCIELGARVLKIHPPTQDVDPAEARFRPFYRRGAEKKVIVMVHTGTEHAAETVGVEFCDPQRLIPALEEGCIVIAAHAGMGDFRDQEDFFPNLVGLMRRFSNLYCDTAVLASMFRWRNVPRLLRTPEVLARTIHGSDIPFPANALVFWNRLPRASFFSLLGERNLFERDYRLKQALGVPREVFTRGAKLLEEKKTNFPAGHLVKRL
ncbi:MAG: amidohydrolase family protein [Limisphaerales bacterium]